MPESETAPSALESAKNPWNLRAGDVVFFAGRGPWAWLIWIATLPRVVYLLAALPWIAPCYWGDCSFAWAASITVGLLVGVWELSRRITHVAVVAPYEAGEAIYESTTLCRLPCLVAGRRVSGGQAHWIKDRIETYDGRVWVARLGPFDRLHPRDALRLSLWLRRFCGEDYDALGAALAGTTELKYWLAPAQHSLHKFCSALVAGGLKKVGRFPAGRHSGTVHPAGLARILARTECYETLERIK